MTLLDTELDSFESEGAATGVIRTVRIEHVTDRKGHEYTRREVLVIDESDSNPELREQYRQVGDHFERILRLHPDMEGTSIKDGVVTIPEDNPAANWLYHDKDGNSTQMIEWAGRFPTAIALEPLQRLDKGGEWLADGELDERTLELFTNMVDGIGLRNRGRIYTKLLVEYAQKNKLDELVIISLGSGAAVPNIQATLELEAHNTTAHWKFFDFDSGALMFAQALVEGNDFKHSTFDYGPTWENPETGATEPKGQNYLRAFSVEDESVDVVDALGLWEYLTAEQAARFAKKLFAKVKSGGSLIVSNMLPSRPQREFNQKAVGWPGLYLRSETDLLSIVTSAGIDTQYVTMTHSQDGVYVVMEIKKP
ncbi:MAG: hypothetical protein ACOH18_01110 [Candidatus Saccharimonadaceae bacterium]